MIKKSVFDKLHEKEVNSVGAITREGYTFQVEYSVMLQRGAIHVYKDGEFIEEMPFSFHGDEPGSEEIEEVVDYFFKS